MKIFRGGASAGQIREKGEAMPDVVIIKDGYVLIGTLIFGDCAGDVQIVGANGVAWSVQETDDSDQGER